MLDLTTYKYSFSRYSIQTLESIYARHFGVHPEFMYEKIGNRENYRTEILFRLNNALQAQLPNKPMKDIEATRTVINLFKWVCPEIAYTFNLLFSADQSTREIKDMFGELSNIKELDNDINQDRINHIYMHGSLPKGRPANLSEQRFEEIYRLYVDNNFSINCLAYMYTLDNTDKKALNSVYNSIRQYLMQVLPADLIDGKKPAKRENEIKWSDMISTNYEIVPEHELNMLNIA